MLITWWCHLAVWYYIQCCLHGGAIWTPSTTVNFAYSVVLFGCLALHSMCLHTQPSRHPSLQSMLPAWWSYQDIWYNTPCYLYCGANCLHCGASWTPVITLNAAFNVAYTTQPYRHPEQQCCLHGSSVWTWLPHNSCFCSSPINLLQPHSNHFNLTSHLSVNLLFIPSSLRLQL